MCAMTTDHHCSRPSTLNFSKYLFTEKSYNKSHRGNNTYSIQTVEYVLKNNTENDKLLILTYDCVHFLEDTLEYEQMYIEF